MINKQTRFTTQLLKKHPNNKARVLKVNTAHGSFTTPVFMPVGTRAGVNNLTPSELRETNSQIILGGNTYHMLCAPGMKVIQQSGGMHKMMAWDGPMLTDSGGFQVFSLSKNSQICRIEDTGALFALPNSQEVIHMTPEVSLETQKIIGADIIMAFDQCTPDRCSPEEVKYIMDRTHRWLHQSIDYHQKNPFSVYGYSQALFGIIQGGKYQSLREKSAHIIAGLELDGVAIGGETIGFDMDTTVNVIQWIEELLPIEKPRYTMGVGMSPQDLIRVVEEGIDMFDCVAPTRNARHGALYCGEIVIKDNWLSFQSEYENERLQIKKACFAEDLSPIMPSCTCYTCKHVTRAQLHHLFKQKAIAFSALASIHNIHVMQMVCDSMRKLVMDA